MQSSVEGIEKPKIPVDVRRKWQRIVDLMAEIIGVPAGLIMKVEPPYIEVFMSSVTDGNPYQVGDKEHLAGLYCETVIKCGNILLVPDALKNEKWKHNPDVKLGMISYLGLPLLWPDGEPFGTICVLDNKENKHTALYIDMLREFRDVVETHLQSLCQAQRLRETSEEWRRTFDAISDFVCVLDKDLRLVRVNKAFCDFLKKEPKELIGKSCFEVLHGTDKPLSNCPLEETLVTKKATTKEIRDPNSGLSFLISISPIFDDKGELMGYVHVTKGLAEHKRMEAELQKSEEWFRTSVENMLDCFGVYSAIRDQLGRIVDFRVEYVNEAACKNNLMSKEEQIGKRLLELLPAHRETGLFDEYCQTVETGNPLIKESLIYEDVYKKQSLKRAFDIRAVKLGDGFAAAWRDVTERKQMQKKLEEYSEHLEELLEKRTRLLTETQERLLQSERLAAIGEAANMVGHDLRNPLQAITNAAYYLNNELPRLSSTPIPQKTIEILQALNDSVNYADKIVRDLQDFALMKKPMLKKANINTIVKETLSQVKVPRNVKLITELGHLPGIEADRDMMKRVFLNLAMNGIQAMENGGTLKVSSKKAKEFVEVSFKDIGIGVPKENMKKIFRPFFTTKAKGMGIGLAICEKLVDVHGGNIEVESEEGEGTTFTVKLPIQHENGGEN